MAGTYRVAKDVMALTNRGSPGGASWKKHKSTRPRVLLVNHLHSPQDGTTLRRTILSWCCSRVPWGSVGPEQPPTIVARPLRVLRDATCVQHADTGFLIVAF